MQTALLITLCLLSGAMSGCANTMGPSVLSDVIDDDDLQTGTRKEGAHFAWFNLAQKSAQGITVMITGIVLTLVGFTPNVEQDFNTQLALCGILGLLPFICYATGTLLFMRFDLRAEAHAKIVAALELRSNAG